MRVKQGERHFVPLPARRAGVIGTYLPVAEVGRYFGILLEHAENCQPALSNL